MGLLLQFFLVFALLGGGFVAIIVLAGWLVSTPPWHGPVTDHFNGRRFFNRAVTPHNDFADAARWVATRDPAPWGPPRNAEPGAPPVPRVDGGGLRVTFIGHTTLLVQADGLNVLTDPVWSDRCGPTSWFGPRRVRPPAIRFEDLPPIDVVLLSHNHYDHCDLPTLRRLARSHAPRVVVPLGMRRFLARRGIPVQEELDWWQEARVADGVHVVAVPARHFAGRGLFDRDRSLWCGFGLQLPSGLVCFAGDTGFGDHFAEIRERLGAPRLALLPIGAYRPEWFMSRVHMSPSQALEAHRRLSARTSIATHFGTFRLADDGETEAPDAIRAAMRQPSVGNGGFLVPEFGVAIDVT